MKTLFLLMTVCLFNSSSVFADDFLQKFPSAKGWPKIELDEIWNEAESDGSAALVIFHEGQLVGEWGATQVKYNTHSVRKSLLSGLIGIAVDKGMIDITATMEDLSLDDKPPSLSSKEKEATVADLLKARSGIYHAAAYETSMMRNSRPLRGSADPGTTWHYNNWDFNALLTIFERQTKLKIGDAFQQWLAIPLGMEGFDPSDVKYVKEPASIHPAYPFFISARNLAIFGQLYIDEGFWGGESILSLKWINESVERHTIFGADRGYGYMWWVNSPTVVQARGNGGQRIYLDFERKLVIVNRVDTGGLGRGERKRGDTINSYEFGKVTSRVSKIHDELSLLSR